MQHKHLQVILISLFSLSLTVSGQKLVNSPYARFNLGSLEPAASFRSLGMGGIGTAMRDNSSLFFTNPASYSSIDTTSFLFDFGLDYSINVLSDGASSFSSDDINFDHLLMGFPLSKGWGVALGIVPVSNGYYKIANVVRQGDANYDPLVGAYSSYHGGDGGFNNFFLGSGIKLNKNFSVGVNMTILFGQINRVYRVDFIDFYNTFNNNASESLQLGGVNFDYGIQYTTSSKNKYFFNAGASYTSKKYYNTDYKLITYRYTAYGANSNDTVSYSSGDSASSFIPGTLKLGIAFGIKNKLTAGFDFISTKWSKSKIPGSAGYAADTKSYLFGLEYIPEKFSNYSFLRRLEYRVGAHFEDNYLILKGEQIKEYGASFGIGLPMRRSNSKTNLFIDYTRKSGSEINGLHTENYYTMGISLNLYDFWFVKRKYD
jgi:hypothetical protein